MIDIDNYDLYIGDSKRFSKLNKRKEHKAKIYSSKHIRKQVIIQNNNKPINLENKKGKNKKYKNIKISQV